MSKKCTICEKTGMMVGNRVKLRGKYNLTKTTRKQPNLQWVRLASGERIKACAKCIKALGKTK